MATPHVSATAGFGRLDAAGLRERLGGDVTPLILDVRRAEAFREEPGIPGAIPFALDREPMRLPEIERSRPIVVYCL